jgi:hypothetical protein
MLFFGIMIVPVVCIVRLNEQYTNKAVEKYGPGQKTKKMAILLHTDRIVGLNHWFDISYTAHPQTCHRLDKQTYFRSGTERRKLQSGKRQSKRQKSNPGFLPRLPGTCSKENHFPD